MTTATATAQKILEAIFNSSKLIAPIKDLLILDLLDSYDEYSIFDEVEIEDEDLLDNNLAFEVEKLLKPFDQARKKINGVLDRFNFSDWSWQDRRLVLDSYFNYNVLTLSDTDGDEDKVLQVNSIVKTLRELPEIESV